MDFWVSRGFGEPLCTYMCTCRGEPPSAGWEMLRVEIAWIRAKAGCVLRTEVPLHRVITAFYPHTLTRERLQAREPQDPVEPVQSWAPGAPSRRASGSSFGPAPALLAPGARESGGFPARLRHLPSPHPHAPLGPKAQPSSHKWNLLRTVCLPLSHSAASPIH